MQALHATAAATAATAAPATAAGERAGACAAAAVEGPYKVGAQRQGGRREWRSAALQPSDLRAMHWSSEGGTKQAMTLQLS